MTLVELFLWRQKKNLLKMFRVEKRKKYPKEKRPYIDWARQHTFVHIRQYCKIVDVPLWYETVAECDSIYTYANKTLSELELRVDGMADYLWIYFLVRKFQPKIAVETGVSTGWSTLAILRAFQKNGGGHLFSSDLPGPRTRRGNHLIGILAQNEPNADCWDLDIRGDRIALPEIVKKIGDEKIDFFHFDSDKTYEGREFCVNTLMDRFSEDAIVMFDDIYDNFHFRDFVKKFDLDYVLIGSVGVVTHFGWQMQVRTTSTA